MRTIDLSAPLVADSIWRTILIRSEDDLGSIRAELEKTLNTLDADIERMEHQTGSGRLIDTLFLHLVVRWLRPSTVVEVGTYIGKTATAMMTGMIESGAENPQLFTCDRNSPFFLKEQSFGSNIVGFPYTEGTQMFEKLVADGVSADLLYIDGRVGDMDLPLIDKLCRDDTFVMVDDYAGVEKGVVNIMMLNRLSHFDRYFLVEPVTRQLASELGFFGCGHTAMLIPNGAVRLATQ